jgi:hypothetical protein
LDVYRFTALKIVLFSWKGFAGKAKGCWLLAISFWRLAVGRWQKKLRAKGTIGG